MRMVCGVGFSEEIVGVKLERGGSVGELYGVGNCFSLGCEGRMIRDEVGEVARLIIKVFVSRIDMFGFDFEVDGKLLKDF